MRGPRPNYRPAFPSAFLEEAEKMARQRTVKYQIRQRASLVVLLHHHPLLSHSEAAERVQLHPRSVRRWRRRWAQGDFSLEDRSGRGRKADFSPLDHALVKALACERVAETHQPLSRQSLADVTARACTVLGKPISKSTVWRILDTDALKPWRLSVLALSPGSSLCREGGTDLGPVCRALARASVGSQRSCLQCRRED